MDTTLDKILEEHCTSKGFPVILRNIIDLDEAGFAEARANTFGASDSAVLLKVAYSSKKVPMKTIDELVYEKVHNVFDQDIGKKASVRKGKDLEDLIIRKIEAKIGHTILKPAHMYGNNRGLATNFDGIIFVEKQPIPFEIKVCTVWARGNYQFDKAVSEFEEVIELKIPNDLPLQKNIPIEQYIELKANHFGIPKYYYTQLQQQIMFTDAPYGHLGVMDDINWEIQIFTIPRDQHVIDALDAESFHQYARLCVKKGLPLPV